METSGPTSGIPQILSGTTRAAANQWQVGQLLQATVSQTSVGRVLLAIGNRQVTAETSLPIQKGQELTLQVRSIGEQPVLRIVSSLNESPAATVVRLLLPRQGAMTPLLANIGHLAKNPDAPVPPLLRQLAQSMVRQLPTAEAIATRQGLKQAIADSGVFLERQLLQSPAQGTSPLTIDTNFKANLLRLVQLVRNWPGSSQTTPGTGSGAPAPSPQATAQGQPAGTPPATATAPPPGPSTAPTGTGAATPSGQTATPPQAMTASPDQVQRAIRTNLPDSQGSAGKVLPQSAGFSSLPTGSTGTGQAQAALLTGSLPPPFRGAAPLPQPALQASLDLLNRLGNLRTDLLQQSEAALARLQLSQLAALPREGERGLLEWLFELPVRRGDDIDLWALRVFREPQEQAKGSHPPSPCWSVQLAFDLPGLGPMQAQVRLSGEQVSTRFWAQQADTLPVIREHLHELRRALTDAGIEVGDLDCQAGIMPGPKAAEIQPIINEKA